MSAEIKEITPKAEKLSTTQARVLHDATCEEETDRLFAPDAVIKSAKTYTGGNVRKVLRANFAGMTPEEFVAHCRGEA